MKKIWITTAIVILILGLTASFAFATQTGIEPRTQVTQDNAVVQETETTIEQDKNSKKEETTGKLIEMKEKEFKSIEDYNQKYGSEAYGMTAYLLNKVRIYSIPFAFVGIAIAAIFQYVIGIRKLDVRDRGFGVMIAIVTVFVICQVLPLVFAIVVRGFRG